MTGVWWLIDASFASYTPPLEQRDRYQQIRCVLPGTDCGMQYTKGDLDCHYFQCLITWGKDIDGTVFDTQTEDFQYIGRGDDENSVTIMYTGYGVRGKPIMVVGEKNNILLASFFKDS